MRSLSPMFDDAVIDCVASDSASTVQKLFHVAELIWAEGAADRSAFRWGTSRQLTPTS